MHSRIPHGFFSRPEVLEAGDRAALLLLRMSDFASTYETDGWLSDAQIATFGARRGVRASAQRLQDCNLLARDEQRGGYQIVGWLDGHRSAAQVADIRQKRRSAGQRGGQKKAENLAEVKQVASDRGSQVARSLLYPETETETETETTTPQTPQRHPRGEAPDMQEVVDVADSLIEALGFLETPATTGERRYVAKALARGWDADQLLDVAHEAADSGASDVRQYLVGCLRRRANEDPAPTTGPATPGTARATSNGWADEWDAVATWYRRNPDSSLGHTWDPTTGLSERAHAAGRIARSAIRTRSEHEARQAFARAYAEHTGTAGAVL
jgi:hypothetical protein